jgi:hypothetical protein
MMKILRNILAVVLGLAVTMLVNGGLIFLGGSLVPPPAGMNPNDLESVRAHAHLFEAKHFLMPFLAHALGSLAGGCLAALIAANRKMTFALIIGCAHLLGGIAAAYHVPAPVWFLVSDLVVAYLPAAWLGGKLGGGSRAV